jgi:hypothetical protein
VLGELHQLSLPPTRLQGRVLFAYGSQQPPNIIGMQFSADVHAADRAVVDAALSGQSPVISVRYRRRIQDAAAVADEYESYQLIGRVVKRLGVPNSIVVWEFLVDGPPLLSSLPNAARDHKAVADKLSVQDASADNSANSRVMTYSIHQLRNAVHGLDASAAAVAESTSDSSPLNEEAQEDLNGLLKVRA